jgi:hypothetical protein
MVMQVDSVHPMHKTMPSSQLLHNFMIGYLRPELNVSFYASW